jgi:hypothetical protein
MFFSSYRESGCQVERLITLFQTLGEASYKHAARVD